MVVWVKGEAVNMPVDQRAQVDQVFSDGLVLVVLLGTDEFISVRSVDICGVEILSQDSEIKLTMKFVAESFSVRTY